MDYHTSVVYRHYILLVNRQDQNTYKNIHVSYLLRVQKIILIFDFDIL